MGRAYILQASLKWNDSSAVFARVAELIPEDLNDGIRAKEESAWCLSQAGDPERGSNTLRSVLETLDQLEEREPDQARCWWRLGQAYWKMGGESQTCSRTQPVVVTDLISQQAPVRKPTNTSSRL